MVLSLSLSPFIRPFCQSPSTYYERCGEKPATPPLTEPEKLTQKLYRRRRIGLISSSYSKAFNELDFPIMSEECEIMGAVPNVFN